MELNSSEHKRRSKELELQRRRPKQLASNEGNPDGPLFGKLIEKKGVDQRIQDILGRYNDFPMDWNQQVRYLGVSDATPKTPLLLDGKYNNPFDSKFSSNPSTSSGNSNTGASSSLRHEVAEPPHRQTSSSTKRDKGHQSHSHDKIGSINSVKEPSAKSGKSTLGMDDQKGRGGSSTESSAKVSAKPTNILRVSKSAIKPYKSSASANDGSSVMTSNQKATSLKSHSAKEGGNHTRTKHRAKRSHSSSRLLVAADNSTTNPPLLNPLASSSTHTSTTHSQHVPQVPSSSLKSRKETSLPPSTSSVHDPLSHQSNANFTASDTSKEVPPLKRTSSAGTALSKVDKGDHSSTAVSRRELKTETPVATGAVRTNVKKKEKRIKKKSKKDKGEVYKEKMDMYESSLKQEQPLTNQITAPTHMTSKGVPTSDSQMITDTSSLPPISFKVQLAKQRPSDLNITSMNEDSTIDSYSISIILQKLMNPVPVLLSPIPTPIKARPFEFPTTHVQQAAVHKVGPLPAKRPLCSTSSEEDSDDDNNTNREALETALSTLNSNIAAESNTSHQLSAGPAPPYARQPRRRARSVGGSSSSSGNSSSNGSSTDSSSDSESEGEVNIMPTLEKLSKEMCLPTNAITPIKRTPPHPLSGYLISPLALDEAANLSPAELRPSLLYSTNSPNNMLISQNSTGFNPVPPEVGRMAQSEPLLDDYLDGSSESSSNSSSESSSDSDSSDTDNNRDSDIEDAEFKSSNTSVSQSNQLVVPTNPNLSHSSEDVIPFDISGSFMEDADLFSGLTGTRGIPHTTVGTCNQREIEQLVYNPFQLDSSTQPFTATSPQPSYIVSSNDHHQYSSPISNQLCQNEGPESTLSNPPLAVKSGRKRKKSARERTPRKAPKLSIKEAASFHQYNTLSNKHYTNSNVRSNIGEDHSEEGEVTSETEDHSIFMTSSNTGKETAPQSYVGIPQTPNSSRIADGDFYSTQLMVRVPLTDLKRIPDQHKPKATVEPYNIRQTSETKNAGRRNTTDQEPSPSDRSRGRSRGEYGNASGGNRHREEEYSNRSSYHRERPNDRPRSHGESRSNRWERGSSRDRRIYASDDLSSSRSGARHGNNRSWDRDYIHADDYWPDDSPHGDYGSERSRGRRNVGGYTGDGQFYPDRYIKEARRKKHEADKILLNSSNHVDKARAYMDSVVLFMRYGDATEQLRDTTTSSGAPKKTSAFRTYNETISMIKYCLQVAGDSKPLTVLCMRCQSVLLWRMYVLKMSAATSIQKELQEYFIPHKGTQGKSPYTNSSSPLPSPASVGSSASTCSGGWMSTQDPSPSGGAVSVPKHIINKATEHLTISSYVSQSLELWNTSTTVMEQCREAFSNYERSGLSHCSPISHVAKWAERNLRSFRL